MKKRHVDEKIIFGAAVTLLAASLASLVYFIHKKSTKEDGRSLAEHRNWLKVNGL